MPVLLVVDDPGHWPLALPGVDVVSANDYLTDPAFHDGRGVVVLNLCLSYAYQSTGHYVSLLAEARGHRPKPSVATIQDLRSPGIVRFVSDELRALIQRALAPVRPAEFVLSVYFGASLAKRYQTLATALFNQFPAPLLRARFRRRGKQEWQLTGLAPIPAKEVPAAHRDALVEAATSYFAGRRWSARKRKMPRAHIAILVDPDEHEPPSDERALARFERAAHKLGLATERVTRDDYGRLREFDGLFIRTTTYVNHYTYRFASRAEAEGLVVVDSPRSIVRCTNKVFLAEHLARFKVPTPETLVVHAGNRDQVARTLGLPVVLKKPDSAFSVGVVKAESEEQLESMLDELLAESALVVAQGFMPTDYDWRVGIFGGKALYACRYFMAKKHWQIIKHEGTQATSGKVETLRVEDAPRAVVQLALDAARPLGDGLFGVDLKQAGKRVVVIEVNDNPSIDAGYEDKVLGAGLYEAIMAEFAERIERRRSGE